MTTHMTINLIPDSSVASAPVGFVAAMQQAAGMLEQVIFNPITLNITYGWGTIDNVTSNELRGWFGAVGYPNIGATLVPYSQLKALLQASATSADDAFAYANLPTGTQAFPGALTEFGVATGQLKALNDFSGSNGALDGSIGFGTATDSNSWLAIDLHEIAHVMGRVSITSPYSFPTIMDLYRYGSPGVYQWTAGQLAYYSLDGGKTAIADYSLGPDDADWTADYTGPGDPFDGFGNSPNSLTARDIQLMDVLGFNTVAGTVTPPAGSDFIDMLNFVASYGDLINAFGTNQQAAQNWFNTYEPTEQRVDTFDGLDYVASYGDLIDAFKSTGSEQAVLDAGATHFINFGYNEGRSTTFNGLDYIASYGDLINAFGANGDAGAYHYIESGAVEGRTTTFDGLDYIASYGDLINALGANEQAGATHFIDNGYQEGRKTTFDGFDYIAKYTDLMKAFGANNDAGATHYIDNGFSEGRSTSFNVSAYETAHPDLIGKYASNEAFLTAYIDTYKTTGKFLR